jgi:hypothetical protein
MLEVELSSSRRRLGLGMAKLSGIDVGIDPFSSDFGTHGRRAS